MRLLLNALFIGYPYMFRSPSATIKKYNKKLRVANRFKIWVYKMV
jgi:hypothetical protein